MDRRRFIASGLGALTAGPALSGQAEGLTRALERAGVGTSRPLRVLLPRGCEANLGPVIETFTNLSGVAVETTIVALDDINTRLTEDVLLGTDDYDVALPATFGLPDLVHLGVLQPLDSFMSIWDGTYHQKGHLYRHGDRMAGRQYGFQTDGDVYLLFFRNEMLLDPEEQARFADIHGVELALPQDWTSLDRMMRHFHAPDQDRWGGLLFRQAGYVGWEYMARLEAEGMPLFDSDLRPTFKTDVAQKVLEDMIRAGETQHPSVRSNGLFENWDAFERHNVLVNIGWGGSQKSFNAPSSSIRGKLSFAPLPRGKGGGQGYFNWGWSYVLPIHSGQPDLAYLFSALAVSPEVSTRAVRQAGGYFDPFHEAHYSDPGIAETYSQAFLDVHQAVMRGAGSDLYLPGHANYLATLNEHLIRALYGDETPKAALNRLDVDWESITFDFGRNNQRRFYNREV